MSATLKEKKEDERSSIRFMKTMFLAIFSSCYSIKLDRLTEKTEKKKLKIKIKNEFGYCSEKCEQTLMKYVKVNEGGGEA